MNRFSGSLSVVVLGIATVWGQAPAANSQPTTSPSTAQAPAAQPSSSATPQTGAKQSSSGTTQESSISGCMTEYFGIFKVSDTASSKSYQVKAPGTSLYKDENQTVTVKGIVDPAAATPTLYAESVQANGQPCGNAQAANGTTQPGAIQGQQAQPALGAAVTAGQNSSTGTATTPTTGAVAGSTASQTGTTGANSTTGSSTANPSTGTSMSGATSNQPAQPSENKGTPSAGTPSNTPPQSNPQ